MKDWFVYILECVDETIYTGITDDLNRRVAAHNQGKGAKYTKGRRPVTLKYFEKVKGRSEATRRELEIKKMSRENKKKLLS